jgi:hypothetical protein
MQPSAPRVYSRSRPGADAIQLSFSLSSLNCLSSHPRVALAEVGAINGWGLSQRAATPWQNRFGDTAMNITRRQFRAQATFGAWLLQLAAGLWVAGIPVAGAAPAPTIKLFPTTVLEEIRQTGNVAREMESGLQDVIARLDRQQALYVESKCEGTVGDEGCATISKQMGATYLEMLNIMEQRLPEMEQAVNNTRTSLQKRLRSELGQKMTPWDMQAMLLGGDGGTDADVSRPTLRGRSGMRLSDRFSQYYRLVAHAGPSRSSSLAVIASDIYLDMNETSDLIARTRDEISRATLMEQLNQSFGAITPEMQEVVAGVKSILFGETEQPIPVYGPPVTRANERYISPLEL